MGGSGIACKEPARGKCPGPQCPNSFCDTHGWIFAGLYLCAHCKSTAATNARIQSMRRKPPIILACSVCYTYVKASEGKDYCESCCRWTCDDTACYTRLSFIQYGRNGICAKCIKK